MRVHWNGSHFHINRCSLFATSTRSIIFVALGLLSISASAQQIGGSRQPATLPPQQDLQWQGEQNQAAYGPTIPARSMPIQNAQPLSHASKTASQPDAKSVLVTNPQAFANLQQATGQTTPGQAVRIPVALQDASFGLPQPNPTVMRTGLVIPASQQERQENPTPNSAQPNSNPSTNAGNAPANPTNRPEVVDAAITTVTRGMQQLPNDAGQVWRTYDITPYTYAIQTTGQSKSRPEQAIVDWILKETGSEVWFSQPMGVLSADRNKLHVYHTPAMQARLKPIVDRFVQGRGKTQVVGLKLMTIASPNWRSTAFSMMQPIPVTSPGVEAWLMSKENAAILSNQLRNRADYQEQSIGDLVISDGQRYNLAKKRPINFLRSVQLVNNNGYSQYQPINSQIDEGYSIDFSGLSSLDGRSIEAIIGCDINQIEKMQRVTVDLPAAGGQSQPVDLQIPQMVSWNVRERFRWPADQVLVLSCGVVATPGPQRQALFGLPSLLNGTRGRADALMFLEYKGLAPKPSGGQVNRPAAGQSAAAGNSLGTGWTGRAAVGQNGMIPVSPRR